MKRFLGWDVVAGQVAFGSEREEMLADGMELSEFHRCFEGER